MLAKYWKKIGLVIIIIACVFNVLIKLINKLSLDKEMLSSAQYVYDKNKEENKQNEQSNQNGQTENRDNQNERTNESSQRTRNVVNNRQQINNSNGRNNGNN